jgi:hypothetical protein
MAELYYEAFGSGFPQECGHQHLTLEDALPCGDLIYEQPTGKVVHRPQSKMTAEETIDAVLDAREGNAAFGRWLTENNKPTGTLIDLLSAATEWGRWQKTHPAAYQRLMLQAQQHMLEYYALEKLATL